jgi:hypothetical protein
MSLRRHGPGHGHPHPPSHRHQQHVAEQQQHLAARVAAVCNVLAVACKCPTAAMATFWSPRAASESPDSIFQYSIEREQSPGDHGSGLLPGQYVQTQQPPG